MPDFLAYDQQESVFRTLPVELKLLVVQHVAHDSSPTAKSSAPKSHGLAALAAVSKEWQMVAEESVFRKIIVTPRNIKGLQSTLTPVRRSFIREISLEFGSTTSKSLAVERNTPRPLEVDEVRDPKALVLQTMDEDGEITELLLPRHPNVSPKFSAFIRRFFDFFSNPDSLPRRGVALTLRFSLARNLSSTFLHFLNKNNGIELDLERTKESLPKIRGITRLDVTEWGDGHVYNVQTVTDITDALPDLAAVNLQFFENSVVPSVFIPQRQEIAQVVQLLPNTITAFSFTLHFDFDCRDSPSVYYRSQTMGVSVGDHLSATLRTFGLRKNIRSFHVKARLNSDVLGPTRLSQHRVYPEMMFFCVEFMAPFNPRPSIGPPSFLDADLPPVPSILTKHIALDRAAFAARHMPKLRHMLCSRDGIGSVSYDPKAKTLAKESGQTRFILHPDVEDAWKHTLKFHHPDEVVTLKLHELVLSHPEGPENSEHLSGSGYLSGSEDWSGSEDLEDLEGLEGSEDSD